MKISNTSTGKFVPHEEGTFNAVCVDITPLVKQESKFGVREVFRIVFETDAPTREDGSRQCVWSRAFTPSLNEKSNFRKFLRQWFGRDLTAEELAEFDTETLLDRPAQIVITHDHADNGETYSNIAACTPYRGKDTIKASGKFVRKQDREAKGEGASYRGASAPTGGAQTGDAVDGTQAGADWSKVKVHVGNHAGVELRDLDPDAIGRLVDKWLPKHEANPKQTADDKRLAAALKLAQEALAEATTGGDY